MNDGSRLELERRLRAAAVPPREELRARVLASLGERRTAERVARRVTWCSLAASLAVAVSLARAPHVAPLSATRSPASSPTVDRLDPLALGFPAPDAASAASLARLERLLAYGELEPLARPLASNGSSFFPELR